MTSLEINERDHLGRNSAFGNSIQLHFDVSVPLIKLHLEKLSVVISLCAGLKISHPGVGRSRPGRMGGNGPSGHEGGGYPSPTTYALLTSNLGWGAQYYWWSLYSREYAPLSGNSGECTQEQAHTLFGFLGLRLLLRLLRPVTVVGVVVVLLRVRRGGACRARSL